MELFSAEFLSALAAIILIDLVLAGDNAIVIALAARNLPLHLQKRAIIWGTVGAVAVRSAMTVAVVWLLNVPGLLLAGGLLLVWIAYRLLVPREDAEGAHGGAATSFWGAMRTIVIADAVMGLDNVLAVAGAAHGSFLLVVLGLLISIPIVVWGSRLILGFVNRYPAITYLGAAVLAWTAALMVTDEPLAKDFFAARPELQWAIYVLFVGGVLGFGLRSERRRKADLAWVPASAGAVAAPAGAPGPLSLEGGTGMKSILVPVDGSDNAINAVRHVVSRHFEDRNLEVRLLHVRQPLSRHIARFVPRGDRRDWHRSKGEAAMVRARELLDKWGVPYTAHVELGDKARVIEAFARRHGCQGIVMGVSRENPFLSWLKDSLPARVVERSQVPVELIAGESLPALQRYGLPAGLGLALTLVAIAEE